MRDWMVEIIKDIINQNQFASLPGCSTTQALVELVHMWLAGLEVLGKAVRIVFLDFRKKAFDMVDHSILLETLLNVIISSRSC